MSELGIASPEVTAKPVSRMVQSQDGTERPHPLLTESTTAADDFRKYSERVDALFGDRPAYQAVKREKPEHRQMLWLKLNSHNNKEIALITGYSPQHVGTVCKQPWFREAFLALSNAAGKDAVEAFLEGEIVPTLERLVDLRDKGETDAVKLAASNAILDRIRGKPTVKVETKSTGSFQHVVHDAAKLLEESRRLDEQLKANGQYTHSPS